MNKSPKKERKPELYEAILSLQTVEEAMNFFQDLCTVSKSHHKVFLQVRPL